MKTARKLTALAAVLTVIMSLASCGDSGESSSKSGTVSLVTTTTAASESSSEAETTTTTATESEAETTTTTSAPDSSEAETTTTTEAPKAETLADKMKVTYGGSTFGVGDKFADVEKAIGTASDHFQSAHCTSDGMDDIYVYAGMDIAVFDGAITYISLYDNGVPATELGTTACGIKQGSTDYKTILGDPAKTDGTQSSYEDGVYVYITEADGAVNYIMVSALKEALPDF